MLETIGDSTFALRAPTAGACARNSAKRALQQAWPTRTPNASAAKLAQTTITIFIPFCILAFIPSSSRLLRAPHSTQLLPRTPQKRSLTDPLRVIVPERSAR